MAFRERQQLGNYRLTNLLGRGSFGSVYLGEHVYLGIQSAVKVMNTKLPKQVEDPFRTEARTLARLIHPYIVRILDFGMDGPTPFLVLDYAPNGTLRERHPPFARLPLPQVISYVKQIAEALAFAHQSQLVHRDIKPENLLLGRQGEVLVSDFGIAIMVDPSYANPSQDIVGTLPYISPEQLGGFPQPASDQYSLAIIVYEWLTGVRPFEGKVLQELINQQLSASPPLLREKVPDLPSAVEQVVLKALAKNPQQRYATITDFAQALEKAAQLESSLFYAPTILGSLPVVPGVSMGRTSALPATFKTKEEWLAIGNSYYDQREFEEALLAYEEALAIDPNYSLAYIGKGIALRNLQRYEEALSAYERAMQLAPSDPVAYNNKSLVLNNLGRYRESLIFSQRALQLNAVYPAAYVNMSYALRELQRYNEALVACDHAIELAALYTDAYDAKGIVLNALQRYNEALIAFEKAIELDPYSAGVHKHKADALSLLECYEDAVACYRRAIELSPQEEGALQGLNLALDMLERKQR
ncbi:MAG TPA: serine/threonine-protein kinase [Ktedonosporobacter sp.]|nr:serine/threonine-protein kinase [Ktedonosporobacter sp.]